MTREQEIIQYRKKLQPWNDYPLKTKQPLTFYQMDERIKFLNSFQTYDAKKDYVILRESKPNENKHLFELIMHRQSNLCYAVANIVFIFRNKTEMTYEQFKKELKVKYKQEITEKRKLMSQNKDVAVYALSDRRIFYIGSTTTVRNLMQNCRELMHCDYVVTSEDSDRHKIYEYATHKYNGHIDVVSDYNLKPLLKKCGSEDINDFYKFSFSYNDYYFKTYYALKSKVDALYLEYPNMMKNCSPYGEIFDFYTCYL